MARVVVVAATALVPDCQDLKCSDISSCTTCGTSCLFCHNLFLRASVPIFRSLGAITSVAWTQCGPLHVSLSSRGRSKATDAASGAVGDGRR